MKNYIKILMIFLPMFLSSIIIDSIPRTYLGDWKCNGKIPKEIKYHDTKGEPCYEINYIGCNYGIADNHSLQPTWHWGLRRWIIIFAGLTFTGYSIYMATTNLK